MRGAQRRIADYVLDHLIEVAHMSVTAAARASGVSEGSVVRLCQGLGARGFHDFKLAIMRHLNDSAPALTNAKHSDSTNRTMANAIFQRHAQALADTCAVVDQRLIRRATAAILAATRVEVYALGTAAPIATLAAQQFARLGIACSVVGDPALQAQSVRLLQRSDLMLVVAGEAGADTMKPLLAAAQQAGVPTLLIANYADVAGRVFGDVALYTMTDAQPAHGGLLDRYSVMLALIDVIGSELMAACAHQ
jgi:DNA-binding MurR/RpiR family transcriptional regulator